jgi:cysteine desulfurase / selenocysteine lyase
MTTSDLPNDFRRLGDQADLTDLTGKIPAGLPDPAALARLANEFFREASDASSTISPTVASGAGSLPSPPTSEPTIPTEQQLRAMAVSASDGSSAAALPGIQSDFPGGHFSQGDLSPDGLSSRDLPRRDLFGGGIPSGEFSAIPSFSFLDQARSIYSLAPTLPIQSVPALPTQKVPYETEIRELPAVTGAHPFSGFPTGPVDRAMPQIPGTVSHDLDRRVSFDFLEQARSLNRLDASPNLSPVADLNRSTTTDLSSIPFDVNSIRRDFPILNERINGRQLVWLDNAATTHKPNAVIDRLSYFYHHENSNIHRAAHTLAARATDAYEGAREKVRRFVNASSSSEIIFVRGCTEGINLIAQSWGRRNIQKDDEIVITWLEHHANIVPWQMLAAEKGAKLRVAPVDNTGQIILEEYEKLLNPKTRLVSLSHVSNALGTITPVQQMVAMAHRHGARVVVDGAQSVSHLKIDVQAFDCDFFVFSGHKVFAPTGIGVVYGKPDVLEATPPWQGGGNMIADVTFEKTVYQGPPNRFEAGTGSIGDAVALGAAIDYLDRIGMPNITRYEHELTVYAMDAMQKIPGLHLIGTAKEKTSVLSFVLDGYRTEEVGNALNKEGIAVRSGHHCAQPILRRFGQETTVRPSLALYNTCEEIDRMVATLWNLKHGRTSGIV